MSSSQKSAYFLILALILLVFIFFSNQRDDETKSGQTPPYSISSPDNDLLLPEEFVLDKQNENEITTDNIIPQSSTKDLPKSFISADLKAKILKLYSKFKKVNNYMLNGRRELRGNQLYAFDDKNNPIPVFNIDRNNLVQSSYTKLAFFSTEKLADGTFVIEFENEIGLDQGGVKREWLKEIIERMQNPDSKLFVYGSENNSSIIPGPVSKDNSFGMDYYRFLGRLIGIAICNRITIKLHFDKIIYNYLLSQPSTNEDFKHVDPALYRSFTKVKEEVASGTKMENYLDNDDNTTYITKENVDNQIEKFYIKKYVTALSEQLFSLRVGFEEFIPKSWTSEWKADELEYLINGDKRFDIKSLKEATTYSNYTEDSKEVIWFWEYFESIPDEKKERLLLFITSYTRLPVFLPKDGFLNISKAITPTNSLPTSHTCTNQLDMPNYTSKDKLQQKFDKALEFCGSGFDLI